MHMGRSRLSSGCLQMQAGVIECTADFVQGPFEACTATGRSKSGQVLHQEAVSSRRIMLQEKHTLEGWKSAVSILQLFLQSVDLKAMTKFTNAAAPQLTALLASGTA